MSRNDYLTIEQAIRLLSDPASAPPPLAAVAARAGIGARELERTFARFAGLGPRQFLDVQQVERMKRTLRAGAAPGAVAEDVPMHERFVTLEAMTPAEYAAGGAHLDVRAGFHETPFGECLVAATDRGVCGMSFVVAGDRRAALDDLASRWPSARLRESARDTRALAERIFAELSRSARDARVSEGESVGRRTPLPEPLPLLVRGTNFQVRVWEALLRIPPGATATYEELAAMTGHEGATRAVGSALGRNPVAWLIPCHRIIRKTGAIGDYRWGTERKRAMLHWEGAETGSVARPAPATPRRRDSRPVARRA